MSIFNIVASCAPRLGLVALLAVIGPESRCILPNDGIILKQSGSDIDYQITDRDGIQPPLFISVNGRHILTIHGEINLKNLPQAIIQLAEE